MAERVFRAWAEFLDELIADRGISQSDIARALGVSPSRVSEWKNGKARPQPENLARMARTLALDLDVLLALCKYPTGTKAASDPDENELLAIYRLVPSEHRDTVKHMLRGLAVAPTRSSTRRASRSANTLVDRRRELLTGVDQAELNGPERRQFAIGGWLKNPESWVQSALAALGLNRDSRGLTASA